jgi:hypothetical protein
MKWLIGVLARTLGADFSRTFAHRADRVLWHLKVDGHPLQADDHVWLAREGGTKWVIDQVCEPSRCGGLIGSPCGRRFAPAPTAPVGRLRAATCLRRDVTRPEAS